MKAGSIVQVLSTSKVAGAWAGRYGVVVYPPLQFPRRDLITSLIIIRITYGTNKLEHRELTVEEMSVIEI